MPFVEILMAVFIAAVGMGAGWLLRDTKARKQQAAIPPDNEADAEARKQSAKEREVARSVLDQLHDLADEMAVNVGVHSNRVQEITEEITADSDNPDRVIDAVAKIVQANEIMQQQLAAAEQRLQEQSLEIVKHSTEALLDQLTQLANRRAFDDAISKSFASFEKYGRPVSLMLLDIDHFKKFNDTHGHQGGDEVLRGVARVLRESFSKNEIVARYGGEEFAVIFPGNAVDQAQSPAERGRAAIADATFEFEGKMLKVSGSSGLAELRAGEKLEELIRRADDSLYAAKGAGRNCGYWHDGDSCLPIVEATAAKIHEIQEPAANEDEENMDLDHLDPVTGLSNRIVFGGDVDRRVAEWKRGGADVTVVLVQIDDYQSKTQQHGEQVGDMLLRATTQFLRGAMRDMDHICRFDGGTFGLLLPGADLLSSTTIAERMRTAVASYKMSHNGESLHFSVSVGLAQTCVEDSSGQLMERAQDSLDASIEAGGNVCYAHNGHLSEPAAVTADTAS